MKHRWYISVEFSAHAVKKADNEISWKPEQTASKGRDQPPPIAMLASCVLVISRRDGWFSFASCNSDISASGSQRWRTPYLCPSSWTFRHIRTDIGVRDVYVWLPARIVVTYTAPKDHRLTLLRFFLSLLWWALLASARRSCVAGHRTQRVRCEIADSSSLEIMKELLWMITPHAESRQSLELVVGTLLLYSLAVSWGAWAKKPSRRLQESSCGFLAIFHLST